MAGLDSFTKMLVHFDGADTSTTLTDVMGRHTLTAVANAQIDTAQSKFGGASLLIDGNDYVTTALNAGDFSVAANGQVTIDWWYKRQGAPGGVNPRWFTHDTDTFFGCYSDGTSPNFYISAGATAATKNTNVEDSSWHHIACVAWLDGAQRKIGLAVDGTFGTWLNDVQTASAQTILIGQAPGGGRGINGWIDEFRVSNTARWTANFTPPTAQYTTAGRSGGYIII